MLAAKTKDGGADGGHAGSRRPAGCDWFLPMIATLQRAFRIDQDVRDILNVADFVDAAADFQQRVGGRALRIGRIEQAMGELRAPSGGQRPVFSFDIVNHRRLWPRQQRGHHQVDAFAGSRRRERHDVLRTVVTQIGFRHQTEEDAGGRRQSRFGAKSDGGPSGPEKQVSSSLRFRPAGFSSTPRQIPAMVSEAMNRSSSICSAIQASNDSAGAGLVALLMMLVSRRNLVTDRPCDPFRADVQDRDRRQPAASGATRRGCLPSSEGCCECFD